MNKKSLVIGINNYLNFPKLNNCINDANDVHDFLSTQGFESQLCLDPTQEEMIKLISDFKKSLSNSVVSLIYFSGHGLIDDNNNYLVLSDSNIRIREDIKYNCVHADDFYLDDRSKRIHIIIFDACRKNIFSDNRKSIQFGLQRMNSPLGTLVAFSTSPNTASIEKPMDRNGIYTKHLLINFKIPNIPLEMAFKNTRNNVMEETNDKQIPWEESSLIGNNFSFIVKAEFNPLEQELLLLAESNLIQIHSDKLIALLNSPLVNTISLENHIFFLTLLEMCSKWEIEGIIKRTVDEDHLTELTMDYLHPFLVERIIDDNSKYENLDYNIVNDFEITRELNYGNNDLAPPDETYFQFIINEVMHKDQPKIFSCFLFTDKDDKEHFIKPAIITLSKSTEIQLFNTIQGSDVEKLLNPYFKIRSQFEKLSKFDELWGDTNIVEFQ